jgi:hypothetical protein
MIFHTQKVDHKHLNIKTQDSFLKYQIYLLTNLKNNPLSI